ncbi:MAG: SRPBCC family protein, partial [Phenylobacterium sp.]
AIRKTLSVRATPEKAFRVFTERGTAWWPKSHHLGKTPLVEVVMEPGVGGRWYSTHEDGSESPWGDVLAWEPPGRLVLAWRISHQWGYDPNLLTEVEVRFTATGDGETRIDFEHRGLEAFGDSEAANATRASMNTGWDLILGQFKAVADA